MVYGSGCLFVHPKPFGDFTDVIMAHEDTRSMLTEDVIRVITGISELIMT